MYGRRLWAVFLFAFCVQAQSGITWHDGPELQHEWPYCLIRSKALRNGRPVMADVRSFMSHPEGGHHRRVTFTSNGVVGMVLAEDPHDSGEIVKDVLPNSQAVSAGVRKGWIITNVNGQPFRKGERLRDVAADFDKAKQSGETLIVDFDVRTYLDCAQGDCANSDRFPAVLAEACADACAQVPDCDWWTHGKQDDDSTCWLQNQQGSSLMTWPDTTTAAKSCAPRTAPKPEEATTSWPGCAAHNTHISEGAGAIFTDVRPFITHPNSDQHRVITFRSQGEVGMLLSETPRENGEMVSDVIPGSQAWSAGVRKGWIIQELDGKTFKASEDLGALGRDFTAAKEDAPTLIVKFDVRTSIDCTDGDCSRSDKFPAMSQGECAAACGQVSGCRFWTYGLEDEDMMCWFRDSDRSIRPTLGSSSGSKSCAPPQNGGYIIFFLALFCYAAYRYRQEMSDWAQEWARSRGSSDGSLLGLQKWAGRPLELDAVPGSTGAHERRSLMTAAQSTTYGASEDLL